MKEIITEVTLKLTFIEKVTDKKVDECITKDKSIDIQRAFADMIAEQTGADDVKFVNAKHFVNDVKRGKKK